MAKEGRTAQPTCVGFAMLAAAVILAASTRAIYPDGHWDHATKLTEKNFEPFVKEQVDAGKTLFVRWIASAG